MALPAHSSSSISPLLISYLLSLLLLPSFFTTSEAKRRPPIANGLSWTFYKNNCPQLEFIIRRELIKVFSKDIGQAAGLLRLHFHDCFVQGCGGSVLVDESSEKFEIPNLTLRKQAFEIVEKLRQLIHKQCGPIVSCSDILSIAARDSVYLTGGPDYDVPLGRRDGVKLAPPSQTCIDLVGPSANTTTVLSQFARKGLDTTDAVALSGSHTIGISHCASFTDRLYPTQDPTMEKTFANSLIQSCPTSDSNNTVVMDFRSPNIFDNKYYVDLVHRQGLFTSDQDLFTDTRTRDIVTRFAVNERLFFKQFAVAMIRMGQLDVLTGNEGEIRTNCSTRNSNSEYLVSVEEENLGSFSEMR